jgi:hypothetical protein
MEFDKDFIVGDRSKRSLLVEFQVLETVLVEAFDGPGCNCLGD